VSGGGKSEVEVGWHVENVGYAKGESSKEMDSPLLNANSCLHGLDCIWQVFLGISTPVV